MNYDDFRMAWQEALAQARLQTWSFTNETITLRNMARAYRTHVSLGGPTSADAFNVAAELSWEWDALLSARSETVEEDMLLQVLGDERRGTPTIPPWLRVDIVLHATRPWGKPLQMPAPAVWQRWVAEVESSSIPCFCVTLKTATICRQCWRGAVSRRPGSSVSRTAS